MGRWAPTTMGGDLEFHAFCLTRTGTRLDQFARAIRSRVRPGDAVVDLGSGTGILAFLACQAGARRVYAIEAGDALSFAELLAAAGGFQDRIEFIRKPSTHVVLPERVDAIVADIHDTFGLQQNGLAALIDARDRFLKPGGALIPSAIELLVAPVEAPDLYRTTIEVWRQTIHGVNLSPLRALAVNSVNSARFEPAQLLAAPASLATIDLTGVQAPRAGGTALGHCTRDGTLHGACGCFRTTLADGIVIGNVPGDSGTTNFAQAFFPVEAPLSIAAGDPVSIRVDTHDGSVARWQVEVTRRGGEPPVRFDHSTFQSVAFPADGLQRQSSDYRPRLTPWGAMERALLGQFDGTRPASELEAWLTERFGDTLPSRREAAAMLKAIIERCG
jgi:type I protein arginine methyltransferase